MPLARVYPAFILQVWAKWLCYAVRSILHVCKYDSMEKTNILHICKIEIVRANMYKPYYKAFFINFAK